MGTAYTVPSPSSSPHYSPPPSAVSSAYSSKRCTLTRTIAQTFIFCSKRATTHGARSSQQSRSTTTTLTNTDVHAENELQAWGATASISQRYPSTHQQKKLLVRAQARCPAHFRKQIHDSFARRTSPGPTPLKLLNLGRAD
jgi:hypothetical protein